MQLQTFFVERGHSCLPGRRGTAEADKNVGAPGHGAGRSADILVRRGVRWVSASGADKNVGAPLG
ncbi:MAG: hypothetical protein AAB676_04630 [Verrucomicrobiota bacterium]